MLQSLEGLPRWRGGKESIGQCSRCKRPGFEPSEKKIPWSRKWQPTPVFLPGKLPGWRNLAGYKSMGSQRVGHKRAHMQSLETIKELAENKNIATD